MSDWPEHLSHYQRIGRERQDFGNKFDKLIERLIVEGAIDPIKGTSFVVVQGPTNHSNNSLEETQREGKPIYGVTMPNPIEVRVRGLINELEGE